MSLPHPISHWLVGQAGQSSLGVVDISALPMEHVRSDNFSSINEDLLWIQKVPRFSPWYLQLKVANVGKDHICSYL